MEDEHDRDSDSKKSEHRIELEVYEDSGKCDSGVCGLLMLALTLISIIALFVFLSVRDRVKCV